MDWRDPVSEFVRIADRYPVFRITAAPLPTVPSAMVIERRPGRDQPPVGRRAPLVNRILLAVLGSSLRPLVGGGLCALRYRTRTGATVTLPVRYERDEEGIVVTALVLAGIVEGGLLGWGQASVLRRALSNFPARRWIAYTAGAAGLAYLLGMLPSAVGGAWWVAAVVAVPLLLSIGTAQWLVLRGRVPWALPSIGITAASWLAGLAVFLAFATPLWWSGQALALTVLVGLVGGALMATTVAAVTGLALRSFVR